LDARLRAAGVAGHATPIEAWRALRRHEGQAATVIDLYELVARERGLAAAELPAEERHELAHAAMPDIWPGFELTAESERPIDPIEVVEYDPRWPERFAEWERAIRAALGRTAVRIDHVGSTSVPGLAAKPVIDIQVSVRDLADEDAYVPALEQLGLRLRSRDEFHRYFRPPAARPRDVHVHVCESGSEWEGEHLRFRDHLRRDPGARDAYARVKRQAAKDWADDRMAYTDAKSDVILGILAEADRIRDAGRTEAGRG
jgi:GrpB-like predicted nucleotidyltransferase (UPF0157 family)